MKLKCLQCEHEFDGSISKDKLGWHGTCPECGGSFDVDVPDGRIIMAFADYGEENPYQFFSDFWKDSNCLISYYAFDDPNDFMKAWHEMADDDSPKWPDSMWYWVMDRGELVTSGACSPDDLEIFEDHFGAEIGVLEYTVSLAIDARVDVRVKAKSFEEARERAMYEDIDPEALEFVDTKAVNAEDENGVFKDY